MLLFVYYFSLCSFELKLYYLYNFLLVICRKILKPFKKTFDILTHGRSVLRGK